MSVLKPSKTIVILYSSLSIILATFSNTALAKECIKPPVETGKYAKVFCLNQGLSMVLSGNLDNRKYGFVDKTGKELIPVKYDDVNLFSEGLAVVEINGKEGYINLKGDMVIPLQYDEAMGFSEGRARVMLNKKWGAINQSGELIVPIQYEDISNYSEGLATAKINEKYGYIDIFGREVIPFKYDYAYEFREGVATVILNDEYGMIDKMDTLILPIEYDYVDMVHEGLSVVQLANDGYYGFVNTSGEVVIPFQYDYAGSFVNDVAKVEIAEKRVLIDKYGKVLEFPIKYEDMGSYFSDGLIPVKTHGKWGYMNRDGEIMIPCQYIFANTFINGRASVATEYGKTGIHINTKGELVE